MLRQRAKLVAGSLYIVDLLGITSAFLLAYWTRQSLLSSEYGPLFPLQDYLWVLLGILVSWSPVLYYFKLYGSYRTEPFWVEPWTIFKVIFWGTLIVGLAVFTLKLQYVSRSFIFIFSIFAFFLIAAIRLLIRRVSKHVRRRDFNYRNVLIVGSGNQAMEIANTIRQHPDWGMRISGIITDSEIDNRGLTGSYPVKGTISDLPNLVTGEIIDEVIFMVPRNRLDELEAIFLLCEELGVRTRLALNFFPKMSAKVHLEDLGGIPSITFSTTPYNELQLAVKRTFDIVVSVIVLITLLPLMGLVAIVIKLTSPGPFFFRQTRVGMNGRQFVLYKFRSMVVDAEVMKKDLLHLNEMSGPVFKIRNDPRVTPVGRFIRKYSFDELPQLINVLKGDMSIVGPRPPVPQEVAEYEHWQRRRLSMKPGLTCLWQIQGRNRIIDFERWMKLDLQYIDNWSLKLDLKIFLKTVPLILSGRGAS